LVYKYVKRWSEIQLDSTYAVEVWRWKYRNDVPIKIEGIRRSLWLAVLSVYQYPSHSQ